ncbi:MAG: hypothetical protein HYR91_07145 [Flavobacteriia bacterium]|nr:hypothetical protein [Flavobacteriia bacterium]
MSFSQTEGAKETVKVQKKIEYSVYKGSQSEISNWYLVITPENNYYLLNLSIPENEVIIWFQKFKDSQNLYRATIVSDYSPILNFKKENEPTELISFFLKRVSKNLVELILVDTNAEYQFNHVSTFLY